MSWSSALRSALDRSGTPTWQELKKHKFVDQDSERSFRSAELFRLIGALNETFRLTSSLCNYLSYGRSTMCVIRLNETKAATDKALAELLPKPPQMLPQHLF